jgi:hypothetical protein
MNKEISLEEPFGFYIHRFVTEYNLRCNLEIGSWDGEGSTLCFVEPMRELDDPKELYCIEIDSTKIEKLKEFYSDVSFVKPIHNSSISYEEMVDKDFEKAWNSEYNHIDKNISKETIKSWFDKDIELLKNIKSGAISELKDKKWDSVLIDGGEFTGYSEYCLLKDNTNLFFLDDVHNGFKCNQIYKELKNDSNWVLLVEDIVTRNGFAIFKKK